jgi:hypothetical protein
VGAENGSGLGNKTVQTRLSYQRPLAVRYPLSWPGLSRPSTPLGIEKIQDVDARDNRGHDGGWAIANIYFPKHTF